MFLLVVIRMTMLLMTRLNAYFGVSLDHQVLVRFTQCEAHRRTTVGATRGMMSTFENKQQQAMRKQKSVQESEGTLSE